MAEYRIDANGFYTFLANKTDAERGQILMRMAIAMVEGKTSKKSWITKVGKPRKKKIPKEYTEDFLTFWKAYHPKRRSNKRQAFKAWITNDANIDTCLKALEWQSRTDAWVLDDGRYFPLASTWLNQCRWEDENPDEGKVLTGGYLDMNGIYHDN